MPETAIYQVQLTPDATLEVETSCNVVLVTPERRITITDIGRWINQLDIARTTANVANSLDALRPDPGLSVPYDDED